MTRNHSQKCHAVLIKNNWLLTANHCVDDMDLIRVQCGEQKQLSFNPIKMKDYDVQHSKNDLALLSLRGEFFSEPVQISKIDFSNEPENCFYFAKGRFRKLPAHWQRANTWSEFVDHLLDKRPSGETVNFHLPKFEFKTAGSNDGSLVFDANGLQNFELPVFGDSGSPVLCKSINADWELVGILSQVFPEVSAFATVNVLEQEIQDWITQKTNYF